MPAEVLDPAVLNVATVLEQTTCAECHQLATAVYEQDITCYNEKCSVFFKVRLSQFSIL